MKLTYISTDQWKKIAKAALYVTVSALVSYLISVVADNPALFGTLTPVINALLVIVKQAFTDPSA